ncbi:hypothetical protein [Yersinia enterocolitica]|uniref:hypothetical protein n=1 Tax=Yersinia enterocolitica TaxID=630 RepID=UPI001C6088E2|nr:hypothetical protein [Yersinia enterocolitica]MBW5840068.1 hypothetical protein [Yersinia enterocolitica]MBW5848682.1 hypothetical protein [Yersinia enterocolitica]MBW5857420.1 hypothetical protein [Yersinia enterocolitica]MBW5861751.1 hypothetical protein [Yersinia enterocolitica]MBW5866095.1 hypothetical protein [Yersinia enterocolitica]
MPFSSMMRDKLTLIKQDGTRTSGIKGSVQKKKIFIHRGDLHIEEGDEIEREMPGNSKETYIVLEPGFHQGLAGIPAGYQMDVTRKTSVASSVPLSPPQSSPVHVSNTYNFHGANSRVNNNSTDNSYNYTGSSENLKEIFDFIASARKEIESAALDKSVLNTANQSLDIVESQLKTAEPSKSIIKTLLSALPVTVQTLPSILKLIEMFSNN